ncbi:MAG TPA: Phenylacetic acid catabolic protein, partial [Gemmataceae bacterium]|nr:Phenylacetic acid catabolic protein [Gemmataceae bacterium]
MDQLSAHLKRPLVELLLSVADDKFMLGHRNADWTGLAPILEEDIAFSALAQDEIAHASALYEMVAQLQDTKPDRLAFGRRPEEYRCAAIVELSDGFDWAKALCRNFF